MAEVASGRGWSSGKVTIVVILAVIGIIGVVAGVMYFTEPAKSLPSILGTITTPVSRANAHRSTRGDVALAVGVVLLIAAGITGFRRKSPAK